MASRLFRCGASCSLCRTPRSLSGCCGQGIRNRFYALSYPAEPKNAMDAGSMLAPFLDANLQNAASISFVSHSLGARVVLQTISQMKLPVRRLIVMAGAIDDDCLTSEFQDVAVQSGSHLGARLERRRGAPVGVSPRRLRLRISSMTIIPGGSRRWDGLARAKGLHIICPPARFLRNGSMGTEATCKLTRRSRTVPVGLRDTSAVSA